MTAGARPCGREPFARGGHINLQSKRRGKPGPRLLGAHLSTGRGLKALLAKAQALGCTCVQIFAGNPRGWRGRPVGAAAARAFRREAPACGVRAVVIHASYLVNLASPDPRVAGLSVRALARDLVSARRLGAAAVVVHPGSGRGQAGGEKRLARALRRLLPTVPRGSRLLLEVMAGPAGSLGSVEVLGRIVRRLGSQTGLCLDSAHLCGCGYRLAEAQGFRALLRDVRRYAGEAAVGCIHLNDSRRPCGSLRDRHENLGEGYVGPQGLRRFLAHAAFRRLPFIVETPGFDQQGPDVKNLRRLRRYAAAAAKPKEHDRRGSQRRN